MDRTMELLSSYACGLTYEALPTAVVHQVRGLLVEYGMVIPQGSARLRKRLPRVFAEADHG